MKQSFVVFIVIFFSSLLFFFVKAPRSLIVKSYNPTIPAELDNLSSIRTEVIVDATECNAYNVVKEEQQNAAAAAASSSAQSDAIVSQLTFDLKEFKAVLQMSDNFVHEVFFSKKNYLYYYISFFFIFFLN